MNRFQHGMSMALAAVVLAAPAVAQTTTTSPSTAPATNAPVTVAPGAGGAPSIVPGTNTGGTLGTTGPTLPGVTTNTPAQRNSTNNNAASPPAVTTSNANRKTAAAPVKGANSFTMNEARRRIEAGGFTQVTGLKKDRDGIWRGTGMRDGASVPVYCDYQGNVGAS
jgi:hypothetical protein